MLGIISSEIVFLPLSKLNVLKDTDSPVDWMSQLVTLSLLLLLSCLISLPVSPAWCIW